MRTKLRSLALGAVALGAFRRGASRRTTHERSVLKVIEGAPHGLCSTLKDQINGELLAFFSQSKDATA
jgi:hypothetical protein